MAMQGKQLVLALSALDMNNGAMVKSLIAYAPPTS